MVGKKSSSNILLLPSPMKDFASSCFGDHAVRVADVSCSGHASVSTAPPADSNLPTSLLHSRSLQSSAACTYRSRLTSGKELLIKVTWTRSTATAAGSSLSISVDPIPITETSSHLLRKKKGTRSFPVGNGGGAMAAVFWDYTSAKYGAGPEPVSGFYVIVVVDSEFALLIGDSCEETLKKLEGTIKKAEFKIAGRREQVLGHVAHTTRARFRDGGEEHEIVISCCKKGGDDGDGGEDDGKPEEVLSVCVDNKRVVQVRRLKWNFRGNQTIFVDGAPVDLMWDIRDWFFGQHPTTTTTGGGGGGFASFLFRARSSLDSRLWLEEEQCLWHAPGRSPPFSLLIQSFRRTPS